MSILIKNIEMPQGCFFCICNKHLDPDTDMCILTRDAFDSTFRVVEHRRDNCPLVPVPPHGRLIDADAPIEVWEVKLSDGDSCSFRNIKTTVSKFLLSHLMGEVPPTIIPAEQSGKEV